MSAKTSPPSTGYHSLTKDTHRPGRHDPHGMGHRTQPESIQTRQYATIERGTLEIKPRCLIRFLRPSHIRKNRTSNHRIRISSVQQMGRGSIWGLSLYRFLARFTFYRVLFIPAPQLLSAAAFFALNLQENVRSPLSSCDSMLLV